MVTLSSYHTTLQVNGDCLSCAVVYSPSTTSNIITVHHFTVQWYNAYEYPSTNPFCIQHKVLSYSSDTLSGCSNAPKGIWALIIHKIIHESY